MACRVAINDAAALGEGVCSDAACRVAINDAVALEEGVCSDAACRVAIKTIGPHRVRGMKARKRRGTPRRYVLRETGESVVNRRIPKGGTGAAPRLTAPLVLQWSLFNTLAGSKKRRGNLPSLNQ